MAVKRGTPKKLAEKSRTLVMKGKELLESSRQALAFSRMVLAEAEERAAKKQSTQLQVSLKVRQR